jgi:hypothetical protein
MRGKQVLPFLSVCHCVQAQTCMRMLQMRIRVPDSAAHTRARSVCAWQQARTCFAMQRVLRVCVRGRALCRRTNLRIHAGLTTTG